MDFKELLTITHVVGVALGVGGATFAEIFFLKSLRSGRIEAVEGKFLQSTYFVLRLGMVLLVLSGFGYLVFYRIAGQTWLLYNPKLWAKLTIVLIILFNALLLNARKMPLWLGSALSLTSWYAALILGAWRSLGASYVSIMIIYLLAVIVIATGLGLIRKALGVKV